MLAGSFGNGLRAGYDLLGHELTIANRLMSRASAGEILVTEQIATNCQRFFKFQNLGSEMVKGSQQPVPLFLLLAAQLEIPFDSSKITIGREAELSRLQKLCQSLPTSGLQAVRLVGPSTPIANRIRSGVRSEYSSAAARAIRAASRFSS